MTVSRRDFMLALGGSAANAACGTPITPVPCTPSAGVCSKMPPLGTPLPATRCELRSFDEINHATPTVHRPGTEEELAALLKCIPKGRTLTFRGGGLSLDCQSLNKDIVVFLTQPEFNKIGAPKRDDRGRYFVTTGAGASWWRVVEELAPLGLLPPSVVTGGDATVGGTLSANCVSRSSPIYGKEGNQIRSFRMVLSDGTIAEYCRDSTDPKERAVFQAVIGGFGYLGAVTEVTFDLVAVRSNPGAHLDNPKMFTRSTRHGPNCNWDELLRSLHDKGRIDRERLTTSLELQAGTSRGQLAMAPEWSALSIASFLVGSGMSANLLEQRFVSPETPLRPLPGGIYDKDSKLPGNGERVASWWPSLAELTMDMVFPQGDYVDELFGWMFFLGNSTRRAKDDAHRLGYRLNFMQQSFALPSGTDERRVDTRPVRRFIELIEARFHAADTRPASIDFLHVPADEYVMSASRDFPSFVITISFADRDCDKMPSKTHDMLHELSRDCRSLGGRVHLVKNVVCDRSDLRAMYGDAAAEFRRLKRAYDEKDLFRNEFFERVFLA